MMNKSNVRESRLILASGSPRRQELLRTITPSFRVVVSELEEVIPPGASPCQAVEGLARQKARAVASSYPDHLVIGADTVVALGNEILGKPRDEAHAVAMLEQLSGRKHQVVTGVALCQGKRETVFTTVSDIRMAVLSPEEIRAYVATGEPMDKAGAYAIQGGAAVFIEGFSGDYPGTVGLPVRTLYCKLRDWFPTTEDWEEWVAGR